MKAIKVNLKEKSYNIIVGAKVLNGLGKVLKKLDIGKCAVIVTTPNIKRIWGDKLLHSLTRAGLTAKFEEIADTEKSKSAETCLDLIARIAAYGKSRSIFIIAFGGGVVGDLSGFIASVYKRGVPFVQIPTTVVAQVDSAIGGKVAIDLKAGKNLIGSFYQPKLVFSEIEFLETLPPRELRNGISEIIKYGVIKDRVLFEFMEDNLGKALRADKKALEFLVGRTSRIKAKVVEQDEFDKTGVRAVLNYGHTIGHAVEAAGGYSRYSHGMSISIGMTAANFISKELCFLSSAECARIEVLLKRAGLPTRAKGIAPDRIYEAHLYDKKFIGGRNRFILPLKIGKTKIEENVPEKVVRGAINLICGG